MPDGLKVQPSIPEASNSNKTPSAHRPNDDENEFDSEAWEPFDEVDAVPTTNLRAASQITDGRRDDGDEDDGWVRNPNNPAEMSKWSGQPSIKGSSDTVRMLLLNFSTLGIVFTWGVEMTYGNPYLLSLGLSKSHTSLVWIAGPLSGLVVQPIVGAIADESRSKWGRRRPFIAGGSIIVALGLLVLGFTKEIITTFFGEGEGAKNITIFVAVLSIYVVDFSINAVMSAARSLVVDTLPISKQQDGAAWGGRMSSIGHLIGYAAGAVDLEKITGSFLGDTQFKKLTIIAAVSILGASAVTCWAVTERVLVDVRHDPNQPGGRFKVVHQIWSTILHLPPRIRAICMVQLWAWIGWFPFLFYGTTWVGETYYRYDVPEDAKSGDALGDIGRIGSTALVIYSCITMAGSWVLPLVIRSPEDDHFTPRPPQSIASYVEKLNKYKPSLLTAWMFGNGLFAFALYLAPFATSFRFATVIMCICGLPWTITMWAPPTFLGVEVNKLSGASESNASYQRISNGAVEMTNLDRPGSPTDRHLENGTHGQDGLDKASGSGELSGIYFGILNIYTTIPQFIGTFISTIVFAILEPGKSPELAHDAHPDEHHSTDGPNAIAVCMFIGAVSATMSVYATRKLKYL
ncbi:major facilitator superfamily domain-containing protein [Apiospora phragmitis]|uniref:Major facilitator superfamily domain-containing protein n=1 Tax=Apiospora phragmitis TaxID=2905665 RepID=A0ABR1TVK1_9PEZI